MRARHMPPGTDDRNQSRHKTRLKRVSKRRFTESAPSRSCRRSRLSCALIASSNAASARRSLSQTLRSSMRLASRDGSRYVAARRLTEWNRCSNARSDCDPQPGPDAHASGAEQDRVRHLDRPFNGIVDTHFAETSRNFSWSKLWESGSDRTPGMRRMHKFWHRRKPF